MTDDKSGWALDKKISIKDLLQIGAIIGGGLLALATLNSTVNVLANQLSTLEKRVDKEENRVDSTIGEIRKDLADIRNFIMNNRRER